MDESRKNGVIKLVVSKVNDIFESYKEDELEKVLDLYRSGFYYHEVAYICGFDKYFSSENALRNVAYHLINGTKENKGLICRAYDEKSELYSEEFASEFGNPKNELKFLARVHANRKNREMRNEGKGACNLDRYYSRERLKEIRSSAGKKGGCVCKRKNIGIYTKDLNRKREMRLKTIRSKGHINWSISEKGYEDGEVSYLPLVQYAYMLSLQDEYRKGKKTKIRLIAERLNREVFSGKNIISGENLKHQLYAYRKKLENK